MESGESVEYAVCVECDTCPAMHSSGAGRYRLCGGALIDTSEQASVLCLIPDTKTREQKA